MNSKAGGSVTKLLLLVLAGLASRDQRRVIEYLQEENRVLRVLLGDKRLRFTDDQRRRLAVKAKVLSRATLLQVGSLVTPDTLVRWFRRLVAAKYDSSAKRRPGRPPKPQHIRELVVRLARETRFLSWR